MAIKKASLMSPSVIDADRAALVALRQIKDYAPANPDFSLEMANALEARLRQAEDNVILTTQAKAAAYDARDAARVELHDCLLGIKVAVKAQFGPDSDEVQALGLKKKSDYRISSRRTNGVA